MKLGAETQEMIKLFDLIKHHNIPGTHYHIKNEGKRSIQAAIIDKRMGLNVGMPDYCNALPIGGFGALYIEMKVGKNKVTEMQHERLIELKMNGNYVAVCYGHECAFDLIKRYVNGDELPFGSPYPVLKS